MRKVTISHLGCTDLGFDNQLIEPLEDTLVASGSMSSSSKRCWDCGTLFPKLISHLRNPGSVNFETVHHVCPDLEVLSQLRLRRFIGQLGADN